MYFEVSSDEASDSADQRYTVLSKKFEGVIAKLVTSEKTKFIGHEMSLGIIPTAVDTKSLKTCYTGDITQVADTAQKLVGNQFTEQLTVYASRYKNIKVQDEDIDLSNDSAAWKNFDTSSSSVLLIGSFSDSGDDLNEMEIIKCK